MTDLKKTCNCDKIEQAIKKLTKIILICRDNDFHATAEGLIDIRNTLTK